MAARSTTTKNAAAKKAAAKRTNSGKAFDPTKVNPQTGRNAAGEIPTAKKTSAPKPAAKAAPSKSKQRSLAVTAARKAAADSKRGAGRKLDDKALLAYVKRVQKANPEASVRAELEYAYWVEGIATGRGRFERIWNEALGS